MGIVFAEDYNCELRSAGNNGLAWVMKDIMRGKLISRVRADGDGAFVTTRRADGIRTATWTDGFVCTQAAECAMGRCGAAGDLIGQMRLQAAKIADVDEAPPVEGTTVADAEIPPASNVGCGYARYPMLRGE